MSTGNHFASDAAPRGGTPRRESSAERAPARGLLRCSARLLSLLLVVPVLVDQNAGVVRRTLAHSPLAAVTVRAAPEQSSALSPVTAAAADSFWRKVKLIEQQAQTHAAFDRRTPVTEMELNSFLAYRASNDIPAGVEQPRVNILGNDRLSGTAIVDLDQMREGRKSHGMFDPLNFLAGRLPVSVAGRLSTAAGSARFALESAHIGSVPVPKTVLQELVSYFSRGPSNPKGINLDDPFPLPAGIRRIEVGRGEAIVIQ